MSALRALAPGKVNLCLYVGPVRDDGLHEIVSLVEPVSLADELRLSTAEGEEDQVVCADVDDELAAEALRRFRSATGWAGPPVRLEIDKRVPIAAGMGGGSSDAAAALRLVARAAGHSRERSLAAIAPRIGSDVPALLHGGPSLVMAAGEDVRPLAPLPPHGLVVVPSRERLSTADVYREADRRTPRSHEDLADRYARIVDSLAAGVLPADAIVNDLEPAALALCPAIEPALEAVRRAGADAAMVSGSGPTVVGVFLGEAGPTDARRAAEELRGRFAEATAVEPVGPEFAAVRQ